jgi:hypothetical protein
MTKKEFILSDEQLADGADTVLKAILYQTRRLRNGKTVYVYKRNLDDINTDFGEIDESVTVATTEACGGNAECIDKVVRVKRASSKKKILEEGPVGEQITAEQLADLEAGMLAIEADDAQLNDLLGRLSLLGGRRKIKRITNKRRKTNKRRRNKRRKTNKRR